MFRTQYDASERVYQPAGSRVKTLYGPVFDKRGVMQLEEIGKHDLYMEIQSHADSVDIHVILQRFAAGDVDVLARIQGTYGDFTQMPKTFAEALNTIIAAEQYFDSLPVDTKARFGHSFSQFIASMDSPTFAAQMGLVQQDTASSTSAGSSSPAAGPAATPSVADGQSPVSSSPAPSPAPATE
ncbi:internal scaffolding protein [Sigmofec virus UA08Rod_5894]|uniref:Internal scaffolding protein n=1 Tax=Sigmofec virus UA08Rod_5894 TaxID=2929443 RepID=A0A976N1J7_9VIRU|nr:internal scaffolding protein [Sigmofec virus UA08Rod_5894]